MSVHNVQAELAKRSTTGAVATAYTQTYATATKTHANPTGVAVVTTGVTQTTPFGFVGAAQGDALSTTLNQVIVDLANLKQVVNSIIDDLMSRGIVL
jgi:hypothetical protein